MPLDLTIERDIQARVMPPLKSQLIRVFSITLVVMTSSPHDIFVFIDDEMTVRLKMECHDIVGYIKKSDERQVLIRGNVKLARCEGERDLCANVLSIWRGSRHIDEGLTCVPKLWTDQQPLTIFRD